MAVPSDVQKAVSALTYKKPRHDMLWHYFDGEQPLVYSSEKLREIFSGLNARFTENWCGVVVNSVLDRMVLRSISVANDDAATDAVQAVREESGLVDDEYQIHEDLTVTGEAFVIVWPNEDTGEVEAFQNDSRLCHAEYDGANPRMMRFAAKWWPVDTGGVRLTLYYPDRFEYYITGKGYKVGETPDAKAFEPYGEEPTAANQYGMIPVFHFRSNRRRPKSQLAGVIEVQDMVNKLLADCMVAAEFGAFRQRYVISQAGIVNLQNNPNAIWDLVAADKDSQPTTVGEFQPTELSNYLEAINKLSADIGIISRTPRHYFYAQGGDPSGEALIAMEAPLNHKTVQLQSTVQPTWRDLYAFILMLRGVNVDSRSLWAQYEPAETTQPYTTAQIRELSVRAGLPLTTTLRDEGWTDDELAQMEEDKQAEKVAQASYADAVLSQAQRQFDAGSVV
jgi:hypothetical protein